ncbi:uncharacterized protein LOC135713785 [Ochlerotatus camptorhynchus]|uniref:uncharacterized protein LOC135713785 n=1 Tax=Ochlerotatus camptorhynchus TaxID=644619 RepID=UPI0031D9981F
MMEITDKQTAQNLKNTIEEVLKSYSTDVTHVYACTADNGKNVQKCGQELNKSQQVALNSIEHEQASDDENDDEEDDNECHTGEVDEMLEAVENIVLSGKESCIATLKCAAHTINLVVNDAVDKECDILKKVRKIVKACRKVGYKPFFEIEKFPLPKIDVETRWGSLYEMINSLHSRKAFFEDIGQKFEELHVTADDWTYIEEFTAAFEPLFVLTKALQANDLILGDVFKLLKICQLKLSKIPAANRFSESLKQALQGRAIRMMDNDAFRAALLFDQRWCFIDSPYVSMDERLKAIEHMLKVANILKTFKKKSSIQQQSELPECLAATKSSDDDFETMLEEECQRASTSKLNPSEIDLKVKLLDLANSKTRLPSSTDILKYWEARRYDDEQIYDLAMIALSASATEVSVERCFSGIKLLLEQHRLRMSPSMLNDLMIIRFNKDLLEPAMEKYRQNDAV